MRPCDFEEKKRVKLAVAPSELVPICRWEEQGQRDSITIRMTSIYIYVYVATDENCTIELKVAPKMTKHF